MSLNTPNSKIFVSGPHKKLSYLFDDQNKCKLPYWSCESIIKSPNKVKKILIGGVDHSTFLVWKGENKFEINRFDSEKKIIKKRKFDLKNQQIKDIQSGGSTFLILVQSGKVYSLADSQEAMHCEIPLSNPEKSTFEELRSIPFFNKEKNNLQVESIVMCRYSNYYLCKGGVLYGNGFNKGKLGDGTNNDHKNIPVFIFKGVKRVFGGIGASHIFLITTNNELYSCGCNKNGQLALGNKEEQNSPQKVPNWNGSEISEICCSSSHSIIITNEGKACSCGSGKYNGIGEEKTIFTEIPKLQNKQITKINAGLNMTLTLTNEVELFGWGFTKDNKPTDQYQVHIQKKRRGGEEEEEKEEKGEEEERAIWDKPRKINLPQIFQNNFNIDLIPLEISCGSESIFIYPKKQINAILNDSKTLFDSKKYGNSKLTLSNGNEIPIHKLIVELRINLKLDEIQKIINTNNFLMQEIISFLKWVYFDELENEKATKSIFKSLNLSFPPKKIDYSIKNDLIKLFNNEDEKEILKRDEDEDEDEDEDVDEVEYTKIGIHKLILLTRSGLFRDMFDNLNEKENNINQIKDYTGKSQESLEILLKYFYTDKIELIDGCDPQLVVQELEDSIEYYQLNENSNLLQELKRIKNIYNLI
ncbi:regulator of chromosome condensation [Anaeramoeba flamelloides]|uniref:Regulator of chromosome condensation n=1 Tax=Anaeramoeba flamelloides TaxID=1746091 RepID=A0ABQ8XA11_9EUKA|nr:regulator of chromosome condensation [Anaeramoeba flamelloides]